MSQNLKAVSFTTQWQESFKDIQCYQDSEVNEKLCLLLSDQNLLATISELFSFESTSGNIQFESLQSVQSIDEFQNWVVEHLFPIIETTYTTHTVSGLQALDPSIPYVFVSNHRDIVMDPLILNKALREHGFSTSNCAIGDNLLQHPAANDLALLNRCFKIFRSLKSPRAMLKALRTQSQYIQYLHFTQKENVWIAQKEGRAKDNIDKTNPALIKMLGLAKSKELPFETYLNALNIVPVSFSYEWDPCDIDKAKELIKAEDSAHYEKDRFDDFISTKKGLSQDKGRIHVSFGDVIVASSTDDHKDIAQLIDQSIYQNYRPYPINYACYKRMNASSSLDSEYTKQEINNAIKQLEERLHNENEDVQKRVYAAYSQILSD